MLKRISVEDLVVGMHIKEFCGSWMDHPFWRSAFVLTDAKDLAAIRNSAVKQVWIDSSKGLDVASGAAALSQAQSDAQVEAELALADRGSAPAVPVPLAQEIGRAARICLRSKDAVISMFENARMGKLIEVSNASQVVDEISKSICRNPVALISLARIKVADDYTYMHSVAVCALMVALARELGFDVTRVHSAGVAGLLHDLGKAAMPMDLLKKPGVLSPQEYGIIKGHSAAARELLPASLMTDEFVLDVCLHHHEKMDGSGYPDRLVGEKISQAARMCAVCDVYDAITSDRRYKLAWDPSVSLCKMAEWRGHFDQTVFHAFVKSIGIYPVGSLVRLSSNRLGVVLEQSEKSLTKPRIKIFYSIKNNERVIPWVVDLSHPDVREKIVAREDPAKWKFPDLFELWSGLSQLPW